MYRHILVPTDGSLVSVRAEKAAIEIAKKFGARITVAHVMTPYSPRALGEVRGAGTQPMSKQEYEEVIGKRAKAAASRVVTRARRAKVAADTVLETDDSPSDALVRIANLAKCDLIVMGSSSRVGLERIFIGSVASEVLSGTKTPVLVCH